MIEIDTDALFEVLKTKMEKLYSIGLIQIVTDNFGRFRQKWQSSKEKLQILIVTSAAQVIIATQDIAESFRGKAVFAVQQ
jgi:hypothetical protein